MPEADGPSSASQRAFLVPSGQTSLCPLPRGAAGVSALRGALRGPRHGRQPYPLFPFPVNGASAAPLSVQTRRCKGAKALLSTACCWGGWNLHPC